MIQELKLQGFKNFRDATLPLGNLTLLVGTNASGKSNLRDAFRFLHGVSRGYTLAKIIGEKWIEGGVLQWTGIRGGIREAAYCGQPTFSLQLKVTLPDEQTCKYQIDVGLDAGGRPPRVTRESLYIHPNSELLFDSHPVDRPLKQDDQQYLNVLLGATQYFEPRRRNN